MGKGNSKESSQAPISAFSEDELLKIKKIFNELASPSAEGKNEKIIPSSALVSKFPENKAFGAKFATWTGQTNITFETLVGILELFLRDSISYQIARYNTISFDKYQLFYSISNNKDLSDINLVTEAEALQFLTDILKCFYHSETSGQEKTAELVLNSFKIYGDKQYTWSDFNYLMKSFFPQMNKVVRSYMIGKFLDTSLGLRLPALDSNSKILTPDVLGLFYLSNALFHVPTTLNLLYSTVMSGTSFNRIAYAIKGYGGPTLILVKHVAKEEDLKYNPDQPKECIFGGFAVSEWSDELGYQGESESYVFSLYPKFKAFYTHKGEGGTNYRYLNTKKIQNSKYKVGLGFGGQDFKNYRLWLDDDLESGSYVNADDTTYEKGYLADPATRKYNKFKIEYIEIWGLGGEAALKRQQEFRQQEADIIESQRKVDKKAFLQNSFDREMFFANTFAAANNRHDDTDFRDEMQ